MDDRKLQVRISNVLKDIGIPASLKGYSALMHSVEIVYKDPAAIKPITKGLYKIVAERIDTTSARVERAMRHCIELAFKRGDPEVLYQYFGNSVDSEKGKPTNAEFIASVAEHIRLDKDLL